MSYFAAAVVRGTDGWSASEVSLAGASDVEDVADRLRDVDADASVSLLFVESDDVYLVILRLDEGEDLRTFGSDASFAEESRLGALLLGDITKPALELEEEIEAVAAEPDGDEEPASPPPTDADPVRRG